jgi:hypothetical protein
VGTETNHDLADTDLANIDQSAPRWQLPWFLFEVLLQAATDASQDTRASFCQLQILYPFLSSNFHESKTRLDTIIDRLFEGNGAHDIRLFSLNDCDRNRRSGDHFAILSPTFYDDKIREHASFFALEWVLYNLSQFKKKNVLEVSFPDDQEKLSIIRPIMLKFVMGLQQLLPNEKNDLRELCCKTSVKLLTLAKQWITVYLPHCCSLFNRVHYGLLQQHDIKRLERQGVDPKHIPGSRLRNAVPFVGKDSPSRASEFAQPDICAGLTILAFRYEGLRRSDMCGVVQVLSLLF